jgi:hypothetical protein
MKKRLLVALGACLATTPGCSEEGTELAPTLSIVSGNDQTDTIRATLTKGLVVQLVNEPGPPYGGTVDFVAIEQPGAWLWVGDGVQDFSTKQVSVGTDANGRAAARIRYGGTTGVALVEIKVERYGLTDTASFIIAAGKPVGIRVTPKDTILPSGRTVTYSGRLIDSGQNPVAGPVAFSATGGLAVDAQARVTTGTSGSYWVKVQGTVDQRAAADSSRLVVAPPAQIVWWDFGFGGGTPALVLSDLTGSNRRTLSPGKYGGSSWHPTADRVVTIRNDSLAVIDLDGRVSLVPTGAAAGPSWPVYSPDGQWIYFHAAFSGVYRVKPDGSGLTNLTGQSGDMPDISPDGASMLYIDGQTRNVIRQSLVTGERQAVATGGWVFPRWAPDGQWIAALTAENRAVYLMRPDGSELHRVGEAGLWTGSFSPDGRWLIGGDNLTSVLDLQTGIVTAAWRGSFPAWRH